MDLTGASGNQMAATLHYLQKIHVIEAMNVQDEPFWFLTEEDGRKKVHLESYNAEPRARKAGYTSKKRNKLLARLPKTTRTDET